MTATCYQFFLKGQIKPGETVEWRAIEPDSIEIEYQGQKIILRVIEFTMYVRCG